MKAQTSATTHPFNVIQLPGHSEDPYVGLAIYDPQTDEIWLLWTLVKSWAFLATWIWCEMRARQQAAVDGVSSKAPALAVADRADITRWIALTRRLAPSFDFPVTSEEALADLRKGVRVFELGVRVENALFRKAVHTGPKSGPRLYLNLLFWGLEQLRVVTHGAHPQRYLGKTAFWREVLHEWHDGPDVAAAGGRIRRGGDALRGHEALAFHWVMDYLRGRKLTVEHAAELTKLRLVSGA